MFYKVIVSSYFFQSPEKEAENIARSQCMMTRPNSSCSQELGFTVRGQTMLALHHGIAELLLYIMRIALSVFPVSPF